jgi:polar amino acid transport system ATP-binding protein
VLRGIDLELYRGQIVALIGSSGSGKSTLLRCINLLEQVSDGEIFLGSKDITDPRVNQDEVRRQIGLVFQAYNLFAHMSVRQNITLALRNVKGIPAAEADMRANALLARIGLADFADSYPDKLSGGQQQRAAIMRAVALEPQVLLLDEVTSALDPELVGEVLELIRDLKSRGFTLLVVAQDFHFALGIADRHCVMENGRIVDSLTAAEMQTGMARVQTYLGV